MPLEVIIAAIALAGVSGLPGLWLPRSSAWSPWLSTGLMVIACLAGMAGTCANWSGIACPDTFFPWPAMGNAVVGIDALSAFFLVPVFLMGGLGSVYGQGYWPRRRHPGNGQRLALFWGVLVAGMALLVVSRHAMSFLLGWEAMAVSAFFLITAEDQREECRKAGWIYFVATHIGTLALFALFALWHHATGSYALQPIAPQSLSTGMAYGLFFLALLGFGLKAGMMPLHFWLPGAHAAAPSHVSAMLSGIVLKMGIYGLVRFLSLLPDPPDTWGALILALGATSGLLGVVFALGQHDLKRLLAYHSVENIGIILMGLGLAMLGRSNHHPAWVALGLGGCLLHVWNHALFKSLLFLCAGSVVHQTHTRTMDRLGGLAKKMPWTAALFLLGAVAICGLPPLNGFISEWLVYLGLLHGMTTSGVSGVATTIAVPVLAMIGGLAVACFVKVYGTVFLGLSRSDATRHAHESPPSMLVPMLVLAVGCALIGLVPMAIVPLLDPVIAAWMPTMPMPGLDTLAPLGTIGALAAALAVGAAVATIAWARRSRLAPRVYTWDCGYAQPTPRMQYTASSFAQSIVVLFGWVLRPRGHRPRVTGPFPRPTALHTHVDDAVLDRILLPTATAANRSLAWIRQFQQGLIQHYVFYMLATVIVLLSTLVPFKAILARWLAHG